MCGLKTLSVTPPQLLENLTPGCNLYAAKSRECSKHCQQFMELGVCKKTYKLIDDHDLKGDICLSVEKIKKNIMQIYQRT